MVSVLSNINSCDCKLTLDFKPSRTQQPSTWWCSKSSSEHDRNESGTSCTAIVDKRLIKRLYMSNEVVSGCSGCPLPARASSPRVPDCDIQELRCSFSSLLSHGIKAFLILSMVVYNPSRFASTNSRLVARWVPKGCQEAPKDRERPQVTRLACRREACYLVA
jgi:hypothetical protein